VKVALLLLCNLVVAPGLMYGQSSENDPPLELEGARIPSTLVEPVFPPPVLKPTSFLTELKPSLGEHYPGYPLWADVPPPRTADKKFWFMTAAMFGAATFESMQLRACRQRIDDCGGYGGYKGINYGMRFGIAAGVAGFAYWVKKDYDDNRTKSWLMFPITFIVVSVADGIHTGLKQPK